MSNTCPFGSLDSLTQSCNLMILFADHDMSRAKDCRRSHGPNVKIVNGNDIWNLFDIARQPVLINSGGSLSHQCLSRSHHSCFGGVQYDHTKEAGAHRICIVPFAHLPSGSPNATHIQWLKPNAECSNTNTQGLNYVADDMSKCGLNSHVVVVIAMRMTMVIATMRMPVAQHLHQNQIHSEAEKTDEKHQPAINGSGLDEAWYCLPQQDGRQRPHDGHGEQGSQDFRLLESIGVFLCSLHTRKLQCHQGYNEAAHV